MVAGEVEGVDKEDGHQENTHEEVWHGGGGEGGVEEVVGGEVAGLRRRTTVTLQKINKTHINVELFPPKINSQSHSLGRRVALQSLLR